MSTFKNIFNKLLKQHKLSLRTLAAKTGISSSQLSKYASGHYEPSLKNALLLCKHFDCSLDFLFGLSTEHTPYENTPPPSAKTFCQRLKQLMSEQNTNPSQLSQNAIINRNSIYYWQKAQIIPKLSILKDLAQELHTSIDYLIGKD